MASPYRATFPCRSDRRHYLAISQWARLMIDDTISKIEARIRAAESIKEDRRQELLQLLGTLKSEVARLPSTHDDQVRSIAGFTELSTHEATRAQQNPDLLNLSLKGLNSSVDGFEQSHPRLVQIVNAISHTLSNLGI
jgi:hypothetical protein